jgi:hypothetical protein
MKRQFNEHPQGSCGGIQFEVSGIQTLILLQFNSKKEITFNQMRSLIGLTDDHLLQAINVLTASLGAGMKPLLLKSN